LRQRRFPPNRKLALEKETEREFARRYAVPDFSVLPVYKPEYLLRRSNNTSDKPGMATGWLSDVLRLTPNQQSQISQDKNRQSRRNSSREIISEPAGGSQI
jgi:hypothetical protein